eukprot:gene18064-19873_t
MSKGDTSFLEGRIEEGSELYQKLLFETIPNESDPKQPASINIAPKAGFCMKSVDQDGKKVFVNVCTSENVIKPKDLTEDELKEIIATGDATKFRIPMAIGEMHTEKDNNGQDCCTYDIVIHPAFYKKIEKSEFFKEFFLTLIIEGLESKHSVELNVNYKVLKNRKAMGTLQMQNVRTKSTPVIMEMDDYMYQLEKKQLDTQKRNNQQIQEIVTTKSMFKAPEYKIIKEPPEGRTEFLIMEVKLPEIKTVKMLTLDVGEDCVILNAPSFNLKLDIDLPVNVNNEEVGAQFNKKTKILTITMPCS